MSEQHWFTQVNEAASRGGMRQVHRTRERESGLWKVDSGERKAEVEVIG
jgi:hypothetical protein